MMSNIIKKTLSEGEEVKKYFSICNRYIRIKIIGLLLKYFFIFIAISVFLFFADKAQVFGFSNAQKIIENNNESFSEYGINSNKINFSKINSPEISEQIIKIWVVMLLIFLLIVIPFIIFFNVFYLKISNEFVFTNKRIIVKRGWIETKVKTIYYERITDVSVSQSLLERIIKTGTISISTAGSDGYEAVLWHIKNPYEVKNVLSSQKNKQIAQE